MLTKKCRSHVRWQYNSSASLYEPANDLVLYCGSFIFVYSNKVSGVGSFMFKAWCSLTTSHVLAEISVSGTEECDSPGFDY